MAFVVPAELGHAPYAAPLIDYLASHFSVVQIIAIRDKLFPDLSEDCWLLYADGFGGATEELTFSVLGKFAPSPHPPDHGDPVPLSEWRAWNRRLRPFLLSGNARSLYRKALSHSGTTRLGMIASVGIGYVTGANEFFSSAAFGSGAVAYSGRVSPSDGPNKPHAAPAPPDRGVDRSVAPAR